MEFIVPCHIKINLCLWVGAPGVDGYHPIRTFFLKLRSPEFLRIRTGSVRTVVYHRGDPFYGEHLVLRAQALLRGRIQLPPVEVECEKALPAGGGVGGGSGNAGAFIRWAYAQAGMDTDLSVAAQLGSDVAFLASRMWAAWGEGRGELLTPPEGDLDGLRELRGIIGFPRWAIGTAWAYRMLDQLRGSSSDARLPEGGEVEPLLEGLVRGRVVGLMSNDFIPVAEKVRPEYVKIWRDCESLGALAWGLCGSGSGFFALFSHQEGVERAFAELGKQDYVRSLIPLEVCR
ncbi:4-(cytidine 5'-diphospho)-2-C-methyl-D-erythritol kinase [Thermanaerovibrio acidaminovorans]|uniref:4-diphosphocytidyl-2-C-methyl-D-erythritol kinase n=1 Tax=Thermanaerovibrio acidaminovorans (strain ATCC 49978 / DSM 6589 / Su883) TaxID=525903 RepID=D1B9Q1_THEAS|nr:4-(cytidine 5'-diphospho)-2-C-methyl-D-erythritol kinase [Thermanaerovibrio acidaminovorans]ACZ19004.1 4-(cytidine 5'-diphospho)-2-C-methyl-D- erythritol kinase [Thermanaerovibrio acidaminovorans DSM 6589]